MRHSTRRLGTGKGYTICKLSEKTNPKRKYNAKIHHGKNDYESMGCFRTREEAEEFCKEYLRIHSGGPYAGIRRQRLKA